MDMFIYGVSVISTGLFAGLMMALVFLLQRQWLVQTQSEYALYFKQFLLAAKGHPLITLLTFVSFIGPFSLAVLSSTDRLLLLTAGAVFFIGCFVVTVFLNLPIYRRVIAWKTPADQADWKNVRSKFFVLNVVRFSSALLSLILLLIADF